MKKFASNAAKAQISVEFILGAPKAAAAAAPAAAAAGGAKKVAAKGKAGVAATVAPPSAYDSVPQVGGTLQTKPGRALLRSCARPRPAPGARFEPQQRGASRCRVEGVVDGALRGALVAGW